MEHWDYTVLVWVINIGYVEKAEVAEVAAVAELAKMCKTWTKLPKCVKPPPFTDFRPAITSAFYRFGYLRHLRYLRNLRVLHINISTYLQDIHLLCITATCPVRENAWSSENNLHWYKEECEASSINLRTAF